MSVFVQLFVISSLICVVFGQDTSTVVSASNACASTLCQIGERCVLKQVQCVRAPCPPIAECVPIPSISTWPVRRSTRDAVQCGPNEYYTTCGACEGTCADRHPDCAEGCLKAGCYCPRGFIRDKAGRCAYEDVCDPTF
uniref:TIL domain-containing protein n=1 Tax=Panagrellus redivivus TaxID=6233 RepID=A0A7E4UXQ6_PANRE